MGADDQASEGEAVFEKDSPMGTSDEVVVGDSSAMGSEPVASSRKRPKEASEDGEEARQIISEADLSIVIQVLETLANDNINLIKEKRFRPVRQLIARLSDSNQFLPNKAQLDAHRKKINEKVMKRQRKEEQRLADQKLILDTTLRKGRLEALQALEEPKLAVLDGPCITNEQDAGVNIDEPKLIKLRKCFICLQVYDQLHHFYDRLCPECAKVNWEKRHIAPNLEGRIAVVTGGRVKIGFHTVLKLLNAKCKVIVTTRFPCDSAERFAAQPRFKEWKHLLEIYGLDLRQLDSLERFCDHLNEKYPAIDILINNACQTVRRPAAYYKPLVVREAILDKNTSEDNSISTLVQAYEGQMRSAEASQLELCAEDSIMKVGDAVLPGQTDVNGHLVDLRKKHSWVLRLHEIETPEIAEVFCINALAPFILNRKLKPLLMKSSFKRKFIVNVSAMEGKFYRFKSKNHPHTNMAKAALNMMTRTSAQDYEEDGIYMNSVDTGWINDENPVEKAKAHAESSGFQTPLDEIDAAARILNPIFEYCTEVTGVEIESENNSYDHPPYGEFLKDYRKTEW